MLSKSTSKSKQRIRNEVWKKLLEVGVSKLTYGHIPIFKGQEKAAQNLRKLQVYANAKRVFIPSDQAQYRARVNAVEDGKTLIMATPGLKDGFYQVDRSVANYRLAVQSHQVSKHAKKLHTSYESIGKIDLLLTGAGAVSRQGERIGKGTGFFDKEYAILREIGCVEEDTPIIALVHDLQVYDSLPFEEGKDVPVDYIVTPQKVIKVERRLSRPTGIDWDYVKKSNLARKMRPFKELLKF